MTTPCPHEADLALFSQGRLSEAQLTTVEAHIDECRACRQILAVVSVGSSPLSPREVGVLRAGDRVGRYDIERLMATGGMGLLYSAQDSKLGRRVALKLMRPAFASGPDGRTRLLREAQAMARLAHPNVVNVFDLGEVDGRVFVAMEFVEGGTLRTWMRRPRTWQATVAMFVAAGEGLVAAHDRGIIHRDFKPENVLVGTDGRPRVTDFGLARPDLVAEEELPEALAMHLTHEGAVIGTPAYMSPEQLHGRPADARSDQYSFCVALYEALVGRRPFASRSIGELRSRVEEGMPPAPRDGSVPGHVWAALARGLQPDPAARFPDMAMLLDALQFEPRPSPRRKRWGAVAVGLAVGVTSLGLVAWVAASTPSREPVEALQPRRPPPTPSEVKAGGARFRAEVGASELRPMDQETAGPERNDAMERLMARVRVALVGAPSTTVFNSGIEVLVDVAPEATEQERSRVDRVCKEMGVRRVGGPGRPMSDMFLPLGQQVVVQSDSLATTSSLLTVTKLAGQRVAITALVPGVGTLTSGDRRWTVRVLPLNERNELVGDGFVIAREEARGMLNTTPGVLTYLSSGSGMVAMRGSEEGRAIVFHLFTDRAPQATVIRVWARPPVASGAAAAPTLTTAVAGLAHDRQLAQLLGQSQLLLGVLPGVTVFRTRLEVVVDIPPNVEPRFHARAHELCRVVGIRCLSRPAQPPAPIQLSPGEIVIWDALDVTTEAPERLSVVRLAPGRIALGALEPGPAAVTVGSQRYDLIVRPFSEHATLGVAKIFRMPSRGARAALLMSGAETQLSSEGDALQLTAVTPGRTSLFVWKDDADPVGWDIVVEGADEAGTLLARATGLMKAKALEDARRLLEKCIRVNPLAADCYKNLGSVHARLATRDNTSQDLWEARRYYERFLELAAPDDESVPRVRAILEAAAAR